MPAIFSPDLPIALGADHAGFAYKKEIINWLNAQGLATEDLGTRAGLCWVNEVASLVRQHNNANILCIPARFVSLEDAKTMVNTFMTTAFEGGRHEKRVNKIAC